MPGSLHRHLTYANVMATIAVLLAMGTGTSWAVQKINGKQLKNRSVAAKAVKKNTLGGAEIRESRLKQVPRARNAATLGGLGPSAFLPAGGKAADAETLDGKDSGDFMTGRASVDHGRTTIPGLGPDRNFDTPVGRFALRCQAASADVRYYNTTATSAEIWRSWVGNSAAETLWENIAPGVDRGVAFPQPHHMVLHAGQGERYAEFRVFTARDGTTCHFEWQLVTTNP